MKENVPITIRFAWVSVYVGDGVGFVVGGGCGTARVRKLTTGDGTDWPEPSTATIHAR
jgi:hypothetical protein